MGTSQKLGDQENDGNSHRKEPSFGNKRSPEGTNLLTLSFIFFFGPLVVNFTLFPEVLDSDRATFSPMKPPFFLLPEHHGYIFDLLSKTTYDAGGLLLSVPREPSVGSDAGATERSLFFLGEGAYETPTSKPTDSLKTHQ